MFCALNLLQRPSRLVLMGWYSLLTDKCNSSPDITHDKTRKMTKIVEQIKKLMGSPRNYGKCRT